MGAGGGERGRAGPEGGLGGGEAEGDELVHAVGMALFACGAGPIDVGRGQGAVLARGGAGRRRWGGRGRRRAHGAVEAVQEGAGGPEGRGEGVEAGAGGLGEDRVAGGAGGEAGPHEVLDGPGPGRARGLVPGLARGLVGGQVKAEPGQDRDGERAAVGVGAVGVEDLVRAQALAQEDLDVVADRSVAVGLAAVCGPAPGQGLGVDELVAGLDMGEGLGRPGQQEGQWVGHRGGPAAGELIEGDVGPGPGLERLPAAHEGLHAADLG